MSERNEKQIRVTRQQAIDAQCRPTPHETHGQLVPTAGRAIKYARKDPSDTSGQGDPK